MLVNTHLLKITLVVLVLLSGNLVSAQTYSLQECLDTAMLHNKNLQISRNNIDLGNLREKEAKSNLLPKVTVNADYKYFMELPYQLMPLSTFNPLAPEGQFKEAQFGVPHNINTNLQLAMPLYNPQVYGAIQSTKIASELTELQSKKSEEQIYFEVTNLYYNAQILHHQLAFIDSNLINVNRLLNTIELLNSQLLAKGSDVNKVRLQMEQLNTQKEVVKAKQETVINALKFAMGISRERNIEVDTNIVFHISSDYSSQNILDLTISKTQNELLKNELKTLQKTKVLPSLNLYGTYGKTGFGYDQKPNDFLKFYPIGFVGLQLSYPLFNGTINNKKINQKRIEILNSDIQIEILSEQNKMLVENATQQKSVSIKSAKTSLQQVKLAKSIYSQTIIQQRQGTANLTEVLLADNALREAQQTYLNSVIEYLKADLELKKTSGNILQKN